jgi:hypothetical protein
VEEGMNDKLLMKDVSFSIPAGAIVTIDQAVSMRNITVNGTLQYNGTANTVTTSGNFNISATGKFSSSTDMFISQSH